MTIRRTKHKIYKDILDYLSAGDSTKTRMVYRKAGRRPLPFKGVVAVEANVADPTSWMTEERAKQELKNKLWEMLK